MNQIQKPVQKGPVTAHKGPAKQAGSDATNEEYKAEQDLDLSVEPGKSKAQAEYQKDHPEQIDHPERNPQVVSGAMQVAPKSDQAVDENAKSESGEMTKVQKKAKKMKLSPIDVIAIADGYYGNRRIKPDDKFKLEDESDFSHNWMKKI